MRLQSTKVQVTITLESDTVAWLDAYWLSQGFQNRSEFFAHLCEELREKGGEE